jgi:hypothetical protein
MRLVTGKEYRERINPWLNKNMHIAHSIPVSFPQFRSTIAGEAFLLVVTIALFVVMNVVIALLFSLPGMGSRTVGENLSFTFKSPNAFAVLALIILIYVRLAMIMVSKLKHEVSVAIFGFVFMMLILLLTQYTPALYAWVDGKTMNYYSNAPAAIWLMWCFPSYLIARKLVQQFQEAKSKKIVDASAI